MRSKILGVLPVAIGVAVAVSACSSPASTARPAPSHPARPAASPTTAAAAAVPAGFRRVGGAAQGISIVVPASWVAIDLAKQSIQQGAKAIQIKGVSSSTLIQDMEQLQKFHAVEVFDIQAVTSGASHFATNMSAYCSSSGVNNTGSSGIPLMKQSIAGQLNQVGAKNLTQQDVTIGGVPGVQTSYQLSSATGTIFGTQLEVLPAPNRACFATLTGTAGQFPVADMKIVAATAQFP